jgi:hypothetical protein
MQMTISSLYVSGVARDRAIHAEVCISGMKTKCTGLDALTRCIAAALCALGRFSFVHRVISAAVSRLWRFSPFDSLLQERLADTFAL